jgi:hypothetical protein
MANFPSLRLGEMLAQYLNVVQSGWSGCRTGNRKKLSSSQTQLGKATYLAVSLRFLCSIHSIHSVDSTFVVNPIANIL